MQSPMEPRGRYAFNLCEAAGCEKQAHMSSDDGFNFCPECYSAYKKAEWAREELEREAARPAEFEIARQVKAGRAAVRAANNVKAPVLTR